jgi:hypothetical protein
MRERGGHAFVDVYKISKHLLELLNFELSQEESLKPVNVPEQKSSPIYAKIVSNKIILDTGAPAHPLLQRQALAKTREYLREEIADLSSILKNSNIDRRFTAQIDRLIELLEFDDDAGAIALGLHARSVGLVLHQFKDELPEVLLVQISATLTHISYFASQYKDWVDFLHNAVQYPAREVIDAQIDASLVSVTSTLATHQSVVDDRIPSSFRLISQLLQGDKEDRAGAIYAGVKGFENICIVAVRYAYSEAIALLRDSAKKARPALVKMGAATIILVTLAIIADFLPIIKNAPDLNWILENIERIEKLQEILK